MESNAEVTSASAACLCYYTASSKLNSQLLWCDTDKQLYKRNKRLASGALAFTCTIKGCGARIYESGDDNKIYSFAPGYKGHKHGTAEQIKEKNDLKTQIKTACQDLDDSGSNIKSVTDIFNSTVDKYG